MKKENIIEKVAEGKKGGSEGELEQIMEKKDESKYKEGKYNRH